MDRLDLDCHEVTKLGESSGWKSLCSYGDNRKNEILDRICRQYVADPSDPLHYTTWSVWKVCTDSGYALTKLGEEMTSNELLQVYQYGKSIDAGFQAVAFKQFFHRAIYEAKMSGYTTPKINMRTAYPYPLVELVLDHVHCRGMNESECMDYLTQTLDLNTYWHPENATFPMIDAVALCREYQGFNVRGEMFMALISVITEDVEPIQPENLDKLKRALKSNTKLRKYNHVFLVVQPKAVVTGYCICRGAPSSTPFAAMEGS
ncbi:hypothetical protein LEN26_004070 [Aphanomyces euteiches]|nr:hypothetical protein LEN26_004070 [Aphanomyces euteiches]